MKKMLLLLCMALPHALSAQQVAKGITAANGKFIGFYQYTPTGYNASSATRYPLIIFLHGIGERGNGTSELWKVKRIGIPAYIDKGNPMTFTWNGKTDTFLVLSPQCAEDTRWYYEDYHVNEMIKYAKSNLRIDTNRIILAGLSMGGGGVWKFASASAYNAGQLAAAGVSCGACIEINGSAIPDADLPVWAFHGLLDTSSNARPQCTFDAIDSIKKYQPAVKPILTIYPDGTHIIWDRVYDTGHNYQDPNIFEWFLAQNKSLPPNVLPLASAGPDIVMPELPAQVTLDGSSSHDADGRIIKYYWRKLSGPRGGDVAAQVLTIATVNGVKEKGIYTYQLKVVDDRAGWSYDTIRIIVGMPDIADPPGVDSIPDSPSPPAADSSQPRPPVGPEPPGSDDGGAVSEPPATDTMAVNPPPQVPQVANKPQEKPEILFLSIVPNRSATTINLAYPVHTDHRYEILIYNSMGGLVKMINTPNDTSSIDVSSLQKGIYYVVVLTSGGRSHGKFARI